MHENLTATPEEVERARDSYASEELQVDDNAAVIHADDGVWVAAWVWLPREEE